MAYGKVLSSLVSKQSFLKEKFHMASTSAVAQIMAKIERNARMLGLTIVSSSGSSVVIDNGSNGLTITYVS